jgi:hypothetical protein
MEFGMQFFPDVGPAEKDAAAYFDEALRLVSLLDLVDEVRKIKLVKTPVAQMRDLLLDPGDMIDFVKVGAFGRAAEERSIASLFARACAPPDWRPRWRHSRPAAKKSSSSRAVSSGASSAR